MAYIAAVIVIVVLRYLLYREDPCSLLKLETLVEISYKINSA